MITLCDKAREVCPEFPDHAAADALEHPRPRHGRRRDQASYPAFQHTAAEIDTRIRHLLPVLAATAPTEVQP